MQDSIREILAEDLSPGFVKTLIDRLGWAYNEAFGRVKYDSCLGEPEQSYLRPHFRHSFASVALQQAADSAGLVTRIEANRSRNYNFAVVEAGRVSLTISYVDDASKMPRPAKFRSQFSAINHLLPQLSFEFEENTCVPGPGSIYGIVVHSADPIDGISLGPINIGFPAPSFKQWIYTIDLYDIAELHQIRFQKPEEDLQAQVQAPSPRWKVQEGTQEDSR